MPAQPPARARTSWTIYSVPICTRDGAERPDQTYHRLPDDTTPPSTPPPEVYLPWAATGSHVVADEHVFRDEGYSGSRLDRPGLDALRDAVHDGAIGIVAVLTPDRLARRSAYQVLLLEEFRRASVEVAFLQHPISDDPDDQLLLQIQGAIAEYERAVLGERFRRGKLPAGTRWPLSGSLCPLRLSPHAAPGRPARPPNGGRARGRDGTHLYGWLIDEQTTIRPGVTPCGLQISPASVHSLPGR